MILSARKKYLQVALNSTMEEAHAIISSLPASDRILIEAGTPLIKAYGAHSIRQLKSWYQEKVFMQTASQAVFGPQKFNVLSAANQMFAASSINRSPLQKTVQAAQSSFSPYIVADLKTMDRGDREAEIAAKNGASAAICLGEAPVETIDSFIRACESYKIDSMIDMMNVEYPLGVLRRLKKIPDVVIVHRGVDEEKFNKEKMVPLHEIRRIKGAYDVMISIAGGDTIREVQRAIFNDADIVVVWKEFYQSTANTGDLAEQFLKEIR